MSHKLGELENPYIQIVWEDDSSNFSQERIKSIKEYFQKKYSSQNVNIITKLKTQNQEDQQVTEVALNILDKDQQKNMIRSYLESKSQQNYLDQILEIDKNDESYSNLIEKTKKEKWTYKGLTIVDGYDKLKVYFY
jgi:predicted ATP-grasp superfamily ATP-dependent carboligase